MARVILNEMIREMSGSLCKKSAYYYRRTPSGKTIICMKPGYREPQLPALTPEQVEQQKQQAITEAQRKQRERFSRMQAMVAEIMQSTVMKEWYRERWQAQVKKRNGKATLRGYIMSCLSEKEKGVEGNGVSCDV